MDHYKAEKGERGEARVENLQELVSAARGFVPEDLQGMTPLSAFLSHAALGSRRRPGEKPGRIACSS